MTTYTTACPRNCYSTCTMKVRVEGGRLVGIDPHPQNQATFEGPCLKGLSYVERVRARDRILFPMRRNRSGGFDRIEWREALDEIADRLSRIRDEHGPQAILFYKGSGTKGLLNDVSLAFWRLFGGCTTTYGDLCWPAGLEATRLTLGENKHNAPWDIARARTIVMWGKNTAETNIHQMVYVNRAREDGARVIVVDPRRTQTSEIANLVVQPRPGSDGALALALARLLIEDGRVDRDFVDRHVLGYEEFAASLAEWTPGNAARVTDVPEATIREFARSIATGSPVTINAGFGMQRYTNSGQTMRAMIALLALTGNIGKPGAGWIFANLQGDVFDEVKDPIAFYPPEEPDGVVRVSISTSKLGRDVLAATDPPIRMVWVERGNPVTQNPETNTVLEAFRSLDFRVTVDQFFTDTAREADIVLPAKSMFEQSDVIWAYWHPYIQLKQKVLDPPGEVKPETEVYWHLAHALGLDPRRTAAAIPEPGDKNIERYLEHRLEPFPDITLERLREGPVLAPGCEEVAFADGVFPTPSGKIELLSEEAAARWGTAAIPVYEEPEESTRRNSPVSDRYPLYLMTPNTKDRIHSQFNNLMTIRRMSPKPLLSIGPEDARARGIANGAKVRVFNDRGSIEIEARFDLGIKPGCVSVTNGWWITDGGTVNFCSLGRETDMGHGAAFHDNLVDVEPLS